MEAHEHIRTVCKRCKYRPVRYDAWEACEACVAKFSSERAND